MAWLNVDTITKTATAHRDNCSFIQKGLDSNKASDWLQCGTVDEALESAQGLSGYNVRKCSFCNY